MPSVWPLLIALLHSAPSSCALLNHFRLPCVCGVCGGGGGGGGPSQAKPSVPVLHCNCSESCSETVLTLVVDQVFDTVTWSDQGPLSCLGIALACTRVLSTPHHACPDGAATLLQPAADTKHRRNQHCPPCGPSGSMLLQPHRSTPCGPSGRMLHAATAPSINGLRSIWAHAATALSINTARCPPYGPSWLMLLQPVSTLHTAALSTPRS